MSEQEPTEPNTSSPGEEPVSSGRHAFVYGSLLVIVLVMLGYSFLLVVDETLAQTRTVALLVVYYPFLVAATALALILYNHTTPYVSEFKIGWSVIIAGGALLSMSAFVMPVFWYLHVWTPYRNRADTRS